MSTIGIKALRNQLTWPDRSALLAEVLLADAIDKGLIRPPVTPSKSVPQSEKVAAWAEIARELEQDREDRRHNG